MKLVEATADDLDVLVGRWFTLGKSMEEYSDTNGLVYASVEEVPEDVFRARTDDRALID